MFRPRIKMLSFLESKLKQTNKNQKQNKMGQI